MSNKNKPTVNGTEEIKVEFGAGLAGVTRNGKQDSCNFMIAKLVDDDGYEVELHAEVPVEWSPFDDYDDDDDSEFDWDGFDDYSYPILKEEIIRQATEHGVDTDRLKFYWD